jgi:hypothetical protein
VVINDRNANHHAEADDQAKLGVVGHGEILVERVAGRSMDGPATSLHDNYSLHLAVWASAPDFEEKLLPPNGRSFGSFRATAIVCAAGAVTGPSAVSVNPSKIAKIYSPTILV